MSPGDLIISSGPTFEVDGEERQQLAESLRFLTITESVTDMARCEARFINWDLRDRRPGFAFFDGDHLAFGSHLKVSIDVGKGPVELFEGRITALEGLFPENGPPEIQLYAEDGLEALRHARRSRVFTHMTCTEAMEVIASEYGLDSDMVASSEVLAVIAQLDESDLSFIMRLARRSGLELWLEGSSIHLQDRSLAQPSVELTLGAGLRSFRVRADLAEQVTEVGVTGWDVDAKTAIDEVVDDGLVPVQIFGDETGSSVVDQTFGQRIERLPRKLPLNAEEARGLAEADFLARAYRFVIGDGLAEGRPKLRAGKTVSLRGLGPWFEGVYHLVAVRHSFDDANGYRSTFTAERPALKEAPTSADGRKKRRRHRRSKPKTGKVAGKPCREPDNHNQKKA